MLEFLRKHQRYFFFVITVVIIISFSFFGTYSTLGSNMWREQVAFQAVNGHDISRSDVDEMALFLATDSQDKMIFGGVWGPNFLNDGVIRKDFLETGLGQQLALAYPEDLQDDINRRLAKEKKFNLYTNPQAPFVGVEGVWNYFAPQMIPAYHALRAADNGVDQEAFNNRIQLFLAEKQIPASTLRYILRFQEKQYGDWLKPDERLNQMDLSLFGYHTLEDWFGPNFTRLISEFIINAAILAEQQGYQVSNAEVLTDLIRNTQVSYQQNLNNPNLGVTSPEEYLSEQLRRLNMDQARAVKVWRQVLLFRRYFQDAGSNAIVDSLVGQKLNQFAHENVTVNLYRLPEALRLANSNDLQNFETYLYATTKQNKNDPLDLPKEFLALDNVSTKYPELVQKRYELEVAKVNSKTLQAKISLRQMWDWEIDEKNWDTLTKQFPTLGVKDAKSREERADALEALEPPARAAVDSYAKQQIVQSHPEWIAQALADAKPETLVLGLRIEGGKIPFSGAESSEKRKSLMTLLDRAPLGAEVTPDSPLYNYSADNQVFYRIAVLGRSDSEEILTFAEANSDGTLDKVRDKILERHYVAIRGKDSSLYQNDKKEWKPLKDVRESVADDYYKKVFSALDSIRKEAWGESDAEFYGKDQIASLRLYPHIKAIQEGVKSGSSNSDQWVIAQEGVNKTSSQLSSRPPLTDQWKVEKVTVTIDRQATDSGIDVGQAMLLQENEWSALNTPINGDLAFYQVKKHGETPIPATEVLERARDAQELLGAEAQRHLMSQVLVELKSKNAISLAYLKVSHDEPSDSVIPTMESE